LVKGVSMWNAKIPPGGVPKQESATLGWQRGKRNRGAGAGFCRGEKKQGGIGVGVFRCEWGGGGEN